MKKLAPVFALFICSLGFAQHRNAVPLIQSPNASSLGTFGNIDITPFNGLANIGVSVFDVQEGDITLQAQLRYFSGGVKPSAHPGWVGQNWSLDVGGVVTRKVNGGVDEVASSQYANDNTRLSYFYRYGLLDDNNWYTDAFIQSQWPNNANPSEIPLIPNLAPDEFSFSLPGGGSGSFFLNHKGKWIVKSKSALDLKVEVAVNNSPFELVSLEGPNTNNITIARLIYSITITDQDGFRYTFGNSPHAIEFTRGPRNIERDNNEDLVANAWYLTLIESPRGNTMGFEYQRKANQYVQTVTYPSSLSIGFTNAINAAGFSLSEATLPTFGVQVITPTYLKKITASSFTIYFDISETTERKYIYDPNAFAGLNFKYGDLQIQDIEETFGAVLTVNDVSKWYKLNHITVSDPAGVVRARYRFGYNDNPQERLFLKKFWKEDLSGQGRDIVHRFYYDQEPLPGYNSLQKDLWGYYNGIPFPLSVGGMSEQQVLDKLSPVLEKARAGILTSIRYPTGGVTNFTYQLNEYAKVVQKSGNAISLANQSGSGGGLRIHKIQNIDDQGGDYTTEYKYINASGASSGILAGNKKVHHSISLAIPVAATIDALDINDYDELNYTEGRDVVYSEVKKIGPDHSYTIYKYSNSDDVGSDSSNPNPSLDESPYHIYSDAYVSNDIDGYTRTGVLNSSNSHPFLSYNSRELERGQLKSETDFNSDGQRVRQVEYAYNEDPARYSEYVRSFDNYTVQASVTEENFVNERYFQAIKIYTYYPSLSSKTETIFDPANGTSVQTATSFAYRSSHRQVRSTTQNNSRDEQFVTEHIYNKDIIDGTASLSGLNAAQVQNLTNMYNNRNIITPIQTTTSKSSTTVSTERYNFNSSYWLNDIWSSTFNNPLEPRENFIKYDGTGNILEYSKSDDVKTAYLYDNNLRIAEITNADETSCAYSSFEPRQSGGWTVAGENVEDPASVTGSKTLTYGSGVIALRLNLPAANYVVSFWSKGGILTVEPSTGANVTLKQTAAGINGWTFYLYHVSGTTLVSLRANGSGSLDELRLYPVQAQMTTYTHLPLVGISSVTDVNDITLRYTYDAMGRLETVYDASGNIMKRYTYNYKQK
jgi:hypothetical protein